MSCIYCILYKYNYIFLFFYIYDRFCDLLSYVFTIKQIYLHIYSIYTANIRIYSILLICIVYAVYAYCIFCFLTDYSKYC